MSKKDITLDILDFGINTTGNTGLVVSSDSLQLESLIEKIELKLDECDEFKQCLHPTRGIRRQPYYRLEFKGGSVVHVHSANMDGSSYKSIHAHRIWINNASAIAPAALSVLRQRLMPGGKITSESSYNYITLPLGEEQIEELTSAIMPRIIEKLADHLQRICEPAEQKKANAPERPAWYPAEGAMIMLCPVCGKANCFTSAFCQHCGVNLLTAGYPEDFAEPKLRCPQCKRIRTSAKSYPLQRGGTVEIEAEKFCGLCGYRFSESGEAAGDH
jgi:hypothetical protein